jgi:hypothetical protein
VRLLKWLYGKPDSTKSAKIAGQNAMSPTPTALSKQQTHPFKETPTDQELFALGMKQYRQAQPKYNPNALSLDDYSVNKAGAREAYKLFDQCLEANTHHVEALLLRARCAYDLSDEALLSPALRDIERVFDKDARNARAHHIRGILLYSLNRTKMNQLDLLNHQIQYYKMVLELDPNYIDDLGGSPALGAPSNKQFRSDLAAMEKKQRQLLTKSLSDAAPPALRKVFSADVPIRTDERLSYLQQLCAAYSRNDHAEVKRLEPFATQIGKDLNQEGGIERMREIYRELNNMQGSRTLDMHWDGIGEWQG